MCVVTWQVGIDNREEAMLQTLHDPSALRYYELLFQWFRQRPGRTASLLDKPAEKLILWRSSLMLS